MQSEQNEVLTRWHRRILCDVDLACDVILAATGERVDEAMRVVLRHQLERLVIDVVDLTKQEAEIEPQAR